MGGGGNSGGGGFSQIGGQLLSQTGQSGDLGTLLINSQGFWTGLLDFMPLFAMMTGLLFIATGLYRMFRVSLEGGHHAERNGLFGPIGSVIIGGVLVNFGFFTDSATNLIGMDGQGGAFGYMPPTQTAYQAELLHAIFLIVSTLGVVGIYRGALLWKSAGDGENSGSGSPMWNGFWHILGGAAAMNVGPFVHLFGV